MTVSDDVPAQFRVAETGERVPRVALDLALALGQWRVTARTESAWTVRTRDGETLTLRPE